LIDDDLTHDPAWLGCEIRHHRRQTRERRGRREQRIEARVGQQVERQRQPPVSGSLMMKDYV
jgi:hypothetical protein